MKETTYTITIFTQAAGSNKDDLSGKLRFEGCSEINALNDFYKTQETGPDRLVFKYISKSTGKVNTAEFNCHTIVGYVMEKENQ